MLEQLNATLEEEKKTLLLQVNKLLEQVSSTPNSTYQLIDFFMQSQNQNLLIKTLQNKDSALEEERIFS